MMYDEKEIIIRPIVPESVGHNARITSNIRSLTSSLFGLTAGLLGLESYAGFAFYFIATTLVSALIHVLLANGDAAAYYQNPVQDLWMADLLGGLSGFVLTWTVGFNLVTA